MGEINQDRGTSADADHATHEPSRSVSALRVGIASAQRFITWLGPFGMALVGMFVMMVGIAPAQPYIGVSVLGAVIILSAFNNYAERAKIAERAKWAKMIADMVVDEKSTEIKVSHTWESMLPYLDQRISELVAQAIEAGPQPESPAT